MRKFKKCKIKSCNKKAYCKGYCRPHYEKLRRGNALEPRCLWCKKKLPMGKWKFCNRRHDLKYRYHNDEEYRKKKLAYHKENYTWISIMGKGANVFTNGFTKEIKESDFVKKEKDRILKDCIRNPKRYLKG